MVDPQISRRCRSCGASIRTRGAFCPQCGKPTTEAPVDDPSRERAVETEEVFDAAETESVDLSTLATADLTPNPVAIAETIPLEPIATDIDRTAALHDSRATVPLKPHPTVVRHDGSRSRPVREAFGGDVKKGLGKVREISTVVLDEASYDPSARFVLVAAVLFILFLIILLLSEITR